MSEQGQTGQISADGRWRWNGVAWEPVQQGGPLPPSPSLARQRSGPSWAVALLIATATLIFGGVCGIAVGSSSHPATSTGGTVAILSPTAAASPVPAPSPQVLLSVSGSGTKTTEKFTTSGQDWDLAWTYDCTNFGGNGNFIVHVLNGDGSDSNNQGINQLGAKGADTEHYHSGGTFYLEVNSECGWTLKAIG